MSKLFAAFVGATMGYIHGVVAWGCNLSFSSVPGWMHIVVVEKTILVLSIIDISMLVIVLTSGWWVERSLDFMERTAIEFRENSKNRSYVMTDDDEDDEEE